MIRIDRNWRRNWKLAASFVPIVLSLTTSSAKGEASSCPEIRLLPKAFAETKRLCSRL